MIKTIILDSVIGWFRNQAQRKAIIKQVRYRMNMRDMALSEVDMQKTFAQYKAQAVAAEKKGQHQAALRYAAEAQRVQQYMDTVADIKNRMQAAHAIQTSQKAMMQVSGIMQQWTAKIPTEEEMCAVQANMALMQENAKMMTEQQNTMMEMLDQHAAPENSDRAEAYLNELLKTERKEVQGAALTKMNQKLDQLQSARSLGEA